MSEIVSVTTDICSAFEGVVMTNYIWKLCLQMLNSITVKKKNFGAIVIFCNSESILTISISCHGKGIPVIFFNNLLQSLSYNWIKATGEPRGILCYKKEGCTALA